MAKIEQVSLAEGAWVLGAPLGDAQCGQLEGYAELIRKWNTTINLVSRKDIDRLENRHFLDCLAAVPFLQGNDCLDVGSGAGLPGIVLAIAKPQMRYTLCERMARRARFLQTVVRELGLGNVEVIQVDVNTLDTRRFDVVTARAVAKPDVIWSWAEPILKEGGAALIYSSTNSNAQGEANDKTPLTKTPPTKVEEDLDYDFPARVTYHHYQLPEIDKAHTLMRMSQADSPRP